MTGAVQAAEKERVTHISRHVTAWAERVVSGSYQKYSTEQAWVPPANLCEYDTHYCLIMELAGMCEKDIELRVEGGLLVLSGVRPPPRVPGAPDPSRLHLMEIDHGHFGRTLELPADADVGGIDAKYHRGYLYVNIPKRR